MHSYIVSDPYCLPYMAHFFSAWYVSYRTTWKKVNLYLPTNTPDSMKTVLQAHVVMIFQNDAHFISALSMINNVVISLLHDSDWFLETSETPLKPPLLTKLQLRSNHNAHTKLNYCLANIWDQQ